MQQQGWKSDGEGKHRGGNFPHCEMVLYKCTAGAHVTQRNGPRETSKGTRNLHEQGGGRCLVAMPSRPDRARDGRGHELPTGSCGRGGAKWYPSQFPTPAELRVLVGWTDCICSGPGES